MRKRPPRCAHLQLIAIKGMRSQKSRVQALPHKPIHGTHLGLDAAVTGVMLSSARRSSVPCCCCCCSALLPSPTPLPVPPARASSTPPPLLPTGKAPGAELPHTSLAPPPGTNPSTAALVPVASARVASRPGPSPLAPPLLVSAEVWSPPDLPPCSDMGGVLLGRCPLPSPPGDLRISWRALL